MNLWLRQLYARFTIDLDWSQPCGHGVIYNVKGQNLNRKTILQNPPHPKVIRLVRKFSEKQLLGGVLVGVLSFICRK